MDAAPWLPPAASERAAGPVALVVPRWWRSAATVVARRRRGAVAALLLGALTTAALVHLDAVRDLRTERQALSRSRLEGAVAGDALRRSEEAATSAATTLAAARTAVDTTVRRVHRVEGDIRTRTEERDVAQAHLAAAVEELTGVRDSLVSRFEQLGLQGAQISALDACLNGVSRALLQLAFEDDRGATGSLRAVAGPCSSASAALDVLPAVGA